jgi:hypothetical protein
MRKYEISPAVAAAMRNRTLAAQHREVGVPLYLHAPEPLQAPAHAFVEYDAEDGRVEADSFTIGGDEDDDFY